MLERPDLMEPTLKYLKKEYNLVECDNPKCSKLYPRRAGRRFCSGNCRVNKYRKENYQRP